MRAPGQSHSRAAVLLLAALFLAGAVQLVPGSPFAGRANADSPPAPKAVFIVGPTGGINGDQTGQNLADGEKMARQAEAAGMDVRRVFHPNATWDNVLANVQGASLVVYMGHGYGWPSKYTKKMTESRQNGMGLNSFAGSGPRQYTYYGANKIRQSIQLAPNAVVILNHLCYAAGNGEAGMAIPSPELAHERVDNMANGWLAAGAGAVFAFSWWQVQNYPAALMGTDRTMDELFMTRSNGTASGWVGWRPVRFDSVRTPGATSHLDPHKANGFLRAVSGDLTMTAAEFRAGASGTVPDDDDPPPTDTSDPPADDGEPPAGDTDPPSPPPDDGDPPPPDDGDATIDAPQITSLSAKDSGDETPSIAAEAATAFHPNGDGLSDELVVTHTVTRAATLRVAISNQSGVVVRNMSVSAPGGTSKSRWNGRNDAGGLVSDGRYTLTYVPIDSAGRTGTAVSTQALVLTAIKVPKPSVANFFARDGDGLNKSVKFKVVLNKAADVTWRIVNADGATVRTVKSGARMSAGTASFVWNGKTDSGAWAPDGLYRSVVTASTSLGTYTHERVTYAGAFRVTPSVASPARGGKVTLTIRTTEALSGAPRVAVTQPGVASFSVVTKKTAKKTFKVTIQLPTGGVAGTVRFVVSANDKNGVSQSTELSQTLR